MAGYEDVNDAERASQDPAFRLIGSEKVWDRGAAPTSRLQTFETDTPAEDATQEILVPGCLLGLAGYNGVRLVRTLMHRSWQCPCLISALL
jgi:hypothetical protein